MSLRALPAWSAVAFSRHLLNASVGRTITRRRTRNWGEYLDCLECRVVPALSVTPIVLDVASITVSIGSIRASGSDGDTTSSTNSGPEQAPAARPDSSQLSASHPSTSTSASRSAPLQSSGLGLSLLSFPFRNGSSTPGGGPSRTPPSTTPPTPTGPGTLTTNDSTPTPGTRPAQLSDGFQVSGATGMSENGRLEVFLNGAVVNFGANAGPSVTSSVLLPDRNPAQTLPSRVDTASVPRSGDRSAALSRSETTVRRNEDVPAGSSDEPEIALSPRGRKFNEAGNQTPAMGLTVGAAAAGAVTTEATLPQPDAGTVPDASREDRDPAGQPDAKQPDEAEALLDVRGAVVAWSAPQSGLLLVGGLTAGWLRRRSLSDDSRDSVFRKRRWLSRLLFLR